MSGKGGKREGAGRKKGVPNKVTADVRAAAQDMSPNALERLRKLLNSENETVAMAAIREVLDRAYGKSTQPISNDPESGAFILQVIKQGHA